MPGAVAGDTSGDYFSTFVHKAPQKPLVPVVYIGNIVFAKVTEFFSSKDNHSFVLYTVFVWQVSPRPAIRRRRTGVRESCLTICLLTIESDVIINLSDQAIGKLTLRNTSRDSKPVSRWLQFLLFFIITGWLAWLNIGFLLNDFRRLFFDWL